MFRLVSSVISVIRIRRKPIWVSESFSSFGSRPSSKIAVAPISAKRRIRMMIPILLSWSSLSLIPLAVKYMPNSSPNAQNKACASSPVKVKPESDPLISIPSRKISRPRIFSLSMVWKTTVTWAFSRPLKARSPLFSPNVVFVFSASSLSAVLPLSTF